jgi:mevalonate kinase
VAAPVAVSVPGKLILMGEHAVVYGRPALAAAVDLRLTVRLGPLSSGAPARVRLELPGLGLVAGTSWSAVRDYARRAREAWESYAGQPSPERFRALRGGDPAHVVKVALGEAMESLGGEAPEGGHLRIASSLPIGSGFGSSAATAVGVIAAYLAWRSAPLDPERIEPLALEVERRQHGLPSGVDTATVLRGGLLWARKTDGGLESAAVAARSPLLARLRVYDTGQPPEPTGAVVAAVRSRRDRDPARHERLLDRIEAAARALREEMARDVEDPMRPLDLIRDCQACLEELGVVPGPVRSVVRCVEAEGGAAKISGAGSLAGPGAGSLLVYHPEPERISDWRFLQPFSFHPVHLGAEGLRLETDG